MDSIIGCFGCLFQLFIIFLIIGGISKAGKGNSSSAANNTNVDLDDIFNEVMKNSGQNARNSQSVSNSSPVNLLSTPPSTPARRNTRPVAQPKPTRNVLTKPTVHTDHICEDVNYDTMGSLEGGTGSFNLGEPEPTVYYREKPNISFNREDFVKSFIMSEVLQRYDINRIYSRIPSARSDE